MELPTYNIGWILRDVMWLYQHTPYDKLSKHISSIEWWYITPYPTYYQEYFGAISQKRILFFCNTFLYTYHDSFWVVIFYFVVVCYDVLCLFTKLSSVHWLCVLHFLIYFFRFELSTLVTSIIFEIHFTANFIPSPNLVKLSINS